MFYPFFCLVIYELFFNCLLIYDLKPVIKNDLLVFFNRPFRPVILGPLINNV
jgi:hypothetical protein